MGLFDKFTKKAKPEKPTPKRKTKSEKELATEAGEPWVKVINFEVDPEDPGNGAFEIDYNDKFLSQLVRAGYQKERNESEDRIVDRWFQDICRNVLMENYEQWEADPAMRPRPSEVKRDDGRSEVS